MPSLDDRFGSLSKIRAPDLWSEIADRRPGPMPRPPVGPRIVAAVVALLIAATGFAIVASVLGGGSQMATEPTPTPTPVAIVGSVANGPIFFRVGGGSRIEAVEPDGSGRRVVFEDEPARIAQIAWSPDGSRIAYQNPIADERGIFVADPDGSNPVRLTTGANDSWPSWSPDGTQILFSSSKADPSIDLCTPAGADFRCPTDIYVVDADGSNVMRLTREKAPEYQPVWSPDGSRIAFVRLLVDFGPTAIFTMSPDGTDVRQVSSADGGSDFAPSWSPEGGRIAFGSIRYEDWGIWVVDADGTNETLILGGTGAGHVDDPVWSPDGRLVAFVGNLAVDDYSPEDALYVMRPDGTGVMPLADAPGIGVAGDIAWRPLPAGSPQPSPSTTVEPGTLPPADPRIAATVPIVGAPGSASAILYAEGSVWVTGNFVDGGGGVDGSMLFRVDAATNEIVAMIPLEGAPGFVSGGGGLAYGFGSVWVAGYARVDGSSQAVAQRVDPTSDTVIATIPLGGIWGADVAIDGTSVWVGYFGEDHAGVARIDPITNAVTADLPLPSGYVRRVTAVPGGVVATELEWNGNRGPCTVLTAIDPATATIVAREPVGKDCGGADLFAWDGEIWGSGAGLQRVDPSTALLVGDPIPFEPERFPRSFVLAHGREVWFGAYPGGNGNHSDRVARLDAATGAVEYFLEAGGTDAVFAPETGTIWILQFDGSLIRVDLNDR